MANEQMNEKKKNALWKLLEIDPELRYAQIWLHLLFTLVVSILIYMIINNLKHFIR